MKLFLYLAIFVGCLNQTLAQTLAKANAKNKAIEMVGLNIRAIDLMPVDFKYLKLDGKNSYAVNVGIFTYSITDNSSVNYHISLRTTGIYKDAEPTLHHTAFWVKPKYIVAQKIKPNRYFILSVNGLLATSKERFEINYHDELLGPKSFNIKQNVIRAATEVELSWAYEYNKHLIFDCGFSVGYAVLNTVAFSKQIQNIETSKFRYMPGGGMLIENVAYLNFGIGFNYILHANKN